MASSPLAAGADGEPEATKSLAGPGPGRALVRVQGRARSGEARGRRGAAEVRGGAAATGGAAGTGTGGQGAGRRRRRRCRYRRRRRSNLRPGPGLAVLHSAGKPSDLPACPFINNKATCHDPYEPISTAATLPWPSSAAQTTHRPLFSASPLRRAPQPAVAPARALTLCRGRVELGLAGRRRGARGDTGHLGRQLCASPPSPLHASPRHDDGDARRSRARRINSRRSRRTAPHAAPPGPSTLPVVAHAAQPLAPESQWPPCRRQSPRSRRLAV